jgi:alpha-L-rhamnosidase
MACLALAGAASSPASVSVVELRCEHLENPVGIGVRQPRLSWKLATEDSGQRQTAYQILAGPAPDGKPDLWDSGKVASDQSVLVPWQGKPLDSRSRVFWRVRVWDKDGIPSPWSQFASFELGLLPPAAEWKGQWITADLPRYDVELPALASASWISAGSAANQAAAVRAVVQIPPGAVVRNAIIDAAADGLITIYVNGHPNRQGSSSLTAPLRADVRAQLTPGANVLAIGSAAARRSPPGPAAQAGRDAIAAHAAIELEDGRTIAVDTDSSWKAATAPAGDWFAPAFDDSAWPAAGVIAPYAGNPSPHTDNTSGPGRYLRKSFGVAGRVVRARLYATALGVYQASINGRVVNSHSALDPGWTEYTKRVMVQTYDVTGLLSQGKNALGAVLGDGWYAGRLGWMGPAQYGKRPVFAAQLEILHDDGSTQIIATDGSWKAGPGAIAASDPQWGEVIDARKAAPWDTATFDDSSWSAPVLETHSISLDPQRGPPVRDLLELKPRAITRRGGAWIVDFGQNLVGHVRLTARGAAGSAIVVRHAEMLNADGSIYTENLRPALATDKFILAGRGRETFEPLFTFHGFRYAEVAGYPGNLGPGDVRAIVVGSDNPETGSWECSDTNLNQLFSNIVWGQRGNFLSVPTDCPQRDERMGWMGDAQVFAPTAARNADVAAFLGKWMVDVDDGQGARGDFAKCSPRVADNSPGYPVWADAGVIIPWVMYTSCGDQAFLEDHYPHMARWVDYCAQTSPGLILSGGVGDHLAPRPTPISLVDTAYFANSARIVARAAAALGKSADAARYGKIHDNIAAAFDKAFVSTNGALLGDTQTADILALRFDLLPAELRPGVAARLAADVERNGHLTTGFVGVGLICPTLEQIGRADLAWKLVFTDTYPSWLFSVKNGATTIWERWDGWTPERGFQDSSMNSFNHYSLGSVGEWFYSGAAGIELDESHPGYKSFTFNPQFTPRLSYVKASLDSPYGKITSYWHRDGGQILYDVTVPPNTTGHLLPPPAPATTRESGRQLPTPHRPGDSDFGARRASLCLPVPPIARPIERFPESS